MSQSFCHACLFRPILSSTLQWNPIAPPPLQVLANTLGFQLLLHLPSPWKLSLGELRRLHSNHCPGCPSILRDRSATYPASQPCMRLQRQVAPVDIWDKPPFAPEFLFLLPTLTSPRRPRTEGSLWPNPIRHPSLYWRLPRQNFYKSSRYAEDRSQIDSSWYCFTCAGKLFHSAAFLDPAHATHKTRSWWCSNRGCRELGLGYGYHSGHW